MALYKSDGTLLTPVLYENITGEREVTLKEKASNYKKLEITIKMDVTGINWEQTLVVDNPNKKYVPVYFPSFSINSPTNFNITNIYAVLYINENKITKLRYGTINKDDEATTRDLVLITKVAGYNY